MSYDIAALELAQHFLIDEPKALRDRAGELAQIIQDAVDNWIETEHEELDPPETA